MSDIPRNNCKDCGKNTYLDDKDYYMVTHEVWKKYGVSSGMLCMNCLEGRMCRVLQKSDILICPLTTQFNYYTMAILEAKE